MAAVWMLARAGFRRRRRAWLGLGLAIGIAAGGAISAAAGARRSETAFPRFVEWSGEFDLATAGTVSNEERYLAGLDEIPHLPQVARAIRFYSPSFDLTDGRGRSVTFPGVVPIAVAPEDAGEVGSGKILRGRAARPDRPDEATISFAVERPGLAIGDQVRLRLVNDATEPSSETTVAVRIVGVHASPGEFPSATGGSFPSLALTPAFVTDHRPFIPDDSSHLSVAVKLKRGAADVEAFRAEARRRDIPTEFPSPLSEHVAGVQRTIRFESAALWLMAGLLALAALAIFGQALARQAYVEADDNPTLRALGSSRAELLGVGLCRTGVIATVAVLVAVPVAILASPATPIGLARVAEPHPGLAIDAAALALGSLATAGGVLVAPAPALLRTAGIPAAGAVRAGGVTPSRIADRLARAGASPAIVSGVRMATEAGHGGATVPIRSAMLGTVLGVGALVTALGFAASLGHLVDTPRLSGFTWDVQVSGDEGLPEAAAAEPRIRSVREGGDVRVVIAGESMLAFAFDEEGPLRPVVVEGRAPSGPGEIVLGKATMQRAGARIGGRIRVSAPAGGDGEPASVPMTVVGRAVIPATFFEAHPPGVGAAMTLEAAAAIAPFPDEGERPYLMRLTPGTTLDDVLAGPHGQAIGAHVYFVVPRQTPADLRTLAGVSGVPLVLAGALAAMSAATLVHSLVTSVRRRRRDLAILKALGFLRSQAGAAVRWQTTAMTLVAVAVGIPAGIVAARWGWRVFADQIAVFPEPRTAALTVALLAPAALLTCNLIAWIPARAAARTRPALVLRAE